MSRIDRTSRSRGSQRVTLVAAVVLVMAIGPAHLIAAGSPSKLMVQPVASGSLIRVEASRASFRELAAALAVHLDEPVTMQFAGDRLVELRSSPIPPRQALQRAAAAAGLEMETRAGIIITDPDEPRLHLDVKDADVRSVLRSVKTQCGIANMMIDPEVAGRGTFLFDGVPCSEGLRIILASLGLGAEVERNVVHVRGRR